MSKTLTVFTPTYNRGYILSRCYQALCEQTSKDFIWLVVDDGSTDNTKELIENWQKENIIEIKYIYQKNSGKQRAVNTGIKNCDTPFFGFLDSDDYYEKYTVEKFIKGFDKIKDNPKVAGILARRGTPDRKIIGNPNLPSKEFIYNVDRLVKKYRFSGDTCRAYKVEVLKHHLYPEIKDKFILESVMLSSIDRVYDLLIINEIFSISEYLDDGYTKNCIKLYKNNPYGYALGVNQMTIARRGIVCRVKSVLIYTTWCWKSKIKLPFRQCKNKSLFICLLPLSLFLYLIKVPEWIHRKGD